MKNKNVQILEFGIFFGTFWFEFILETVIDVGNKATHYNKVSTWPI